MEWSDIEFPITVELKICGLIKDFGNGSRGGWHGHFLENGFVHRENGGGGEI